MRGRSGVRFGRKRVPKMAGQDAEEGPSNRYEVVT